MNFGADLGNSLLTFCHWGGFTVNMGMVKTVERSVGFANSVKTSDRGTSSSMLCGAFIA